MFLQHYGMREQPFGVTPNPRYLYLSHTHREALASLVYGIEAGRGFMAIIAPPGMGKTTLLFQILERLGGSARTVFLFHTQCNSREFFRYLLTDLGIDSQGSDLARMHDQLNQVLLADARAGRRFVLVIDEAQNLDESVLETVRLLSDFETPRAKLMQIILAGQPQLAEKLALPSLAQLRQRISMMASLAPFSLEDTQSYIKHRLRVAGYEGPALFTSEAIELIATRGGGIPRNINNICFNALSLAFALDKKKIDSGMVLEVLGDLDVGALAQGTARLEQTSLPQPATGRPAAQPARNHVPTVAPRVAAVAKATNARDRSRWLADSSRPALRVAVLATGVFVAASFLMLFLERAKLGERLPLPQAVNASNPSSGAPEASGRMKTESTPSVSPEPLRTEPARQTQRPSPSARADAIDSWSATQALAWHSTPGPTSGSASLHTLLRADQRAAGQQTRQNPVEVRTILPAVPVLQPELTSSLQPPEDAPSAARSAEAGATGSVPPTRVRVGSRAQAAKLVYQPQPEYPEAAKSAHLQGTVRLEAVLAKDGTVASLRVLSGHPLLTESAGKAVQRWRYKPTLVDGSPVEVVTEVDVDFPF